MGKKCRETIRLLRESDGGLTSGKIAAKVGCSKRHISQNIMPELEERDMVSQNYDYEYEWTKDDHDNDSHDPKNPIQSIVWESSHHDIFSHTEATPCDRVCPNRSKKQKRYDQFVNANTETERNLTAANIKGNGWEIPTIPCEYCDRPAGKVPIPTEVNGETCDICGDCYEFFNEQQVVA